MQMRYFFLLLFSLCAQLSLPAQDSNINFFQGSFAEAQEKAATENKLIFLDAYAVWCGPCKWMDKNTFTDQEVANYYNEHFVNVKMDMEKGEGAKLARKYRIRGYPSLLFLHPDGSVAHSKLGAQDAPSFLALGRQALSSKKASQ